jgi:hypothetical protein
MARRNIDFIAAVCEEVYYAGRPKSGRKLMLQDFRELVRMANGTIMRKLYFEERQLRGQFWFFSDQLELREFEVGDPDAKGRREIVIREEDKERKLFDGVLRLPNGLGIYEVSPVGDCLCGMIARAEPGTEWLYCGKAYEDMQRWSPRGKKIVLYNLPKCVEKVEVLAVWNDEDLEIPYDIAFDIVNAVLGLTLKTAGFPIDKSNNADPNLIEMKHKLSDSSSL